MTTQPAVSIGQVWEEVDPRHMRRVTVVSIYAPDDVAWISGIDAKGAKRTTRAKLSSFNGKRGGYRFVEERAE